MCWILISISCSRGRLQGRGFGCRQHWAGECATRAQEHEGVEHRNTRRTRMLAGTHTDAQRSNIIDLQARLPLWTDPLHISFIHTDNCYNYKMNENDNCWMKTITATDMVCVAV
jgi:hypothetical protein